MVSPSLLNTLRRDFDVFFLVISPCSIYEVARRRVPVSALPVLANLFDVSVDELLGAGNKKPAKRGPSSKLQQQLERVSALPRSKQKFVIEMIDAVIQQQPS